MGERRHEDIERLITRKLDGVLSDDEELQLNRAVIRDPALNRLYETSKRVDDASAAALGDLLGADRALGFEPLALTHEAVAGAGRPYGHRRAWWLVPGAIAAAVLAMVWLRPPIQPADSGLVELPLTPLVDDAPPRREPMAFPGSVRQATTSPMPQRRRATARDMIGVMGEDGRIYLIEVDRMRTRTRPAALDGVTRVSDDF